MVCFQYWVFMRMCDQVDEEAVENEGDEVESVGEEALTAPNAMICVQGTSAK